MARPGGLPLAEPLDRLLARLVDGLVLLGPLLVLGVVLYGLPVVLVVVATSGSDGEPSGPLLALAIFGGLWVWTLAVIALLYWYEVVYQLRRGQTVGKRMRGIRIVTLDGGTPDRTGYRRRFVAANALTLVQAVPVLGVIVSSLAGAYFYLDNLWLLWDKPYRQCLHDKYARTTVVAVRS